MPRTARINPRRILAKPECFWDRRRPQLHEGVGADPSPAACPSPAGVAGGSVCRLKEQQTDPLGSGRGGSFVFCFRLVCAVCFLFVVYWCVFVVVVWLFSFVCRFSCLVCVWCYSFLLCCFVCCLRLLFYVCFLVFVLFLFPQLELGLMGGPAPPPNNGGHNAPWAAKVPPPGPLPSKRECRGLAAHRAPEGTRPHRLSTTAVQAHSLKREPKGLRALFFARFVGSLPKCAAYATHELRPTTFVVNSQENAAYAT